MKKLLAVLCGLLLVSAGPVFAQDMGLRHDNKIKGLGHAEGPFEYQLEPYEKIYESYLDGKQQENEEQEKLNEDLAIEKMRLDAEYNILQTGIDMTEDNTFALEKMYEKVKNDLVVAEKRHGELQTQLAKQKVTNEQIKADLEYSKKGFRQEMSGSLEEEYELLTEEIKMLKQRQQEIESKIEVLKNNAEK